MRTTNGLDVPEGWGGGSRSSRPRPKAPTAGHSREVECPACHTRVELHRGKIPPHIYRAQSAFWTHCTTTTEEN